MQTWSPRPLFFGFGFKNLQEIQSLKPADRYIFDSVQKDGRLIRIHLLNDKESQVFIGTGIGSQLTEKVPFILRRRQSPATVFVSCYDLSGDGNAISGIELLPVMENGKQLSGKDAIGLKLNLKGSTLSVAFDLNEKPSPSLSFQDHKLERLLYLKKP